MRVILVASQMKIKSNAVRACTRSPPLIVVNMTVFDEALALDLTLGKETWEPNTNLVK